MNESRQLFHETFPQALAVLFGWRHPVRYRQGDMENIDEQ